MTPHASLLYTTDSDRRSTILSLSLRHSDHQRPRARTSRIRRPVFFLSLSQNVSKTRAFSCRSPDIGRAPAANQGSMCLLCFAFLLSFPFESNTEARTSLFVRSSSHRQLIVGVFFRLITKARRIGRFNAGCLPADARVRAREKGKREKIKTSSMAESGAG